VEHYCPEYRDDCEGCQPALMDPTTGIKFAEDSPEIVAIRGWWKTVTLDDKKAFHRVCCFNSRDPGDLSIMERLGEGMSSAIQTKTGN
jgi:hypothetical protein